MVSVKSSSVSFCRIWSMLTRMNATYERPSSSVGFYTTSSTNPPNQLPLLYLKRDSVGTTKHCSKIEVHREQTNVGSKMFRQNQNNYKAPFTRYNLLSNRLSNPFGNRFDNRLYRVYKHPTVCQTVFVKPVVKPVWQPVWQPVVSCKRGLTLTDRNHNYSNRRYLLYPTILLFTLTTLWINKYHLDWSYLPQWVQHCRYLCSWFLAGIRQLCLLAKLWLLNCNA